MRILLYLATNLAILVLLGIVMSILGLDTGSTSGLLVMAALFGMGGYGGVVVSDIRGPYDTFL